MCQHKPHTMNLSVWIRYQKRNCSCQYIINKKNRNTLFLIIHLIFVWRICPCSCYMFFIGPSRALCWFSVHKTPTWHWSSTRRRCRSRCGPSTPQGASGVPCAARSSDSAPWRCETTPLRPCRLRSPPGNSGGISG